MEQKTPEIIHNLSVDCVVFGFDVKEKSLNVLLINRRLDDAMGATIINDYVLTGYHVRREETLDDTASRVLKELTGLENLYKKQFKAFGNPDRLLNEKDIIWAESEHFNLRTVTIAYYFLVKTEEVKLEGNAHGAKWFSVHDLPKLGFDHHQIITEAYEDLKFKSLHEPITFELLPDKFTIKELQDVYESILGIAIDNRNFRRKLIKQSYIVALNEKQVGVSKKPAQLYMFSKDVYKKVHEESLPTP